MPESHEFRYGMGSRAGAVIATLFFGTWFLAIPWFYFSPPKGQPIGLPAAALLGAVPFGMTLMCLALLGKTFGSVTVDGDGIEVRTLFGKSRREFRELERMEPDTTSRDGCVLYAFEHRPMKVTLDGLVDAERLRSILQARIVPRTVDAETIEFRPAIAKVAFPLAIVIALILVVSPWLTYGTRADAWPLHLFFDSFALLFLALIAQNATTRVRVLPDRVISRNYLGEKTVRFADVRQVRLDLASSRAGTAETITLASPARDLVFSAYYTHYTQLRDALIARCPDADLKDGRPAKLR